MCACVGGRGGGEGMWVARLTAVEWHINECTACNLHYKARALGWCPFNLISLLPHSPTSDNISSAAERLRMHVCHTASRIDTSDNVGSPLSMDIQMREVCSTYREKGERHTWLLLGRPRRRRENNIRVGLQAVEWGEALTGLICLSIAISGWLMWMRLWTFGVHIMWGISLLFEDLLDS
jgi:hypothetical protein